MSRLSILTVTIVCLVSMLVITRYCIPQLFFQDSGGSASISLGVDVKLQMKDLEICNCECEQRLLHEFNGGEDGKRKITISKQYYLGSFSKASNNLQADTTGPHPDHNLGPVLTELLNQNRMGPFSEVRVGCSEEKSGNNVVTNTFVVEKVFGKDGEVTGTSSTAFKVISPASSSTFPSLTTFFGILNLSKIDYLKLSAFHGREIKALNSIPFEHFRIQIFAVEHPDGRPLPDVLQNKLKGKGYKFMSTVAENGIATAIFTHKSIFQ